MAFDVLTVLRQSLRRLATGPALIIAVVFIVFETAAALVPGRFIGVTPGIIGSGAGTSPIVFAANPLPAVAELVVLVVGLYLSLVTIRVFAGQWGIVERDHLTHRVGFGLLNLLGITVAVGIVMAIGLVGLAGLFGIVGLVVGVVLVLVVATIAFFAPGFIAVGDDNALKALRKSLGVLSASPLHVISLLIALLVVNVVLQAIGTLIAGVLGPVSFLTPLVLTFFGALGTVFFLIAIARAYDQTAETA